MDRSTAYAGKPNGNDTLKGKVHVPVVIARIEERRHCSIFGIDPGEIRPFMQISVTTRQCQVLRVVSPTVLEGQDMLDVKPKVRIIVLMDSTVFAAIARSSPDEITRRGIHYPSFPLEISFLAFPCRIEISVPART